MKEKFVLADFFYFDGLKFVKKIALQGRGV